MDIGLLREAADELGDLEGQASVAQAQAAVFEADHAGCAFERFTASGPLALLPLPPTAQARSRMALVWTLPPAEAEALIRQNIQVDREALEELAYARALVIKDYLLDSGQVEAERVFLVKPADVLAPEAVEGIAPGRVVLGLK